MSDELIRVAQSGADEVPDVLEDGVSGVFATSAFAASVKS
jgi:hypothetical protein